MCTATTMNPSTQPDLAERLFQRLLQLLGAPRSDDAPPPLSTRSWAHAYAQEFQRRGSALPPSQVMQRGMERWITAFPEAPETAARTDMDRLDQFEHLDTVPAAFMTLPHR
jgi:hypothetical protein